MASIERKSYMSILITLLLLTTRAGGAAERKTENVILITLDGARTQEIFGGLDLDILRAVTKKEKIEETDSYKRFWAATPEQRREKLMPFFWGTLMKQHGSIAGNQSLGSTVKLTNGMRFSYPGYSEILTGQAHDDVIKSNDKKRNPYPTVLEFLKKKLKLNPKQVAAFSSWDTLDYIIEHEEGAITSNAGFEAYAHPHPVIQKLSEFQFETDTPWGSIRHDAYTYRFARAHLETHKPRVLYLGLGETDDWAHNGRYDKVLEALQRTDEQRYQPRSATARAMPWQPVARPGSFVSRASQSSGPSYSKSRQKAGWDRRSRGHAASGQSNLPPQ